MKKKSLIISIISALLILTSIAYYFNQRYNVIQSSPLDAIPTDVAIFFEVTDAARAIDEITKSDYFNFLEVDPGFKSIQTSFHWLDSISKSEPEIKEILAKQKLYISLHPTKATEFDLLYCLNIVKGHSANDVISLVNDLSAKYFTEDIRVYEDVKIFELKKGDESVLTIAVNNGVIMISRTSFLVEDAIRQLKNGTPFSKSLAFKRVNKQLSSKNTIHLYVNNNGLEDLLSGYISNDHPSLRECISNFCRWMKFDVLINKDQTLFSGNSSSLDSTAIVSSLIGLQSSESQFAKIAPSRTAAVIDFSVSNINACLNVLKKNKSYYFPKKFVQSYIDSIDLKYKIDVENRMSDWVTNEFALVITEPGSENLENNTYAFFHTNDVNNSISKLAKIQEEIGKSKTEKYKGYEISKIDIEHLIPIIFGKIFWDIKQSYYTSIENFIIFGSNPSMLKSLIDDYTDKKTLNKEDDYKRHFKSSLMNGQINIYFNLQRGGNILRSISTEDLSQRLINDGVIRKNIQSLAGSFRQKGEIVTSNFRLDLKSDSKKEIRLLWSTQLDTSASTPPFVVKRGNENLILIQDDNYNLNLFDESGQLIWEKNLGEKIISDFYSLDLYKNGEIQLVFNTATKLFIIDSKGEAVGNFPIRLPAKASNGCLVEDIDGNNHFKIYVACENGMIYNYEQTGKPVLQWTFKNNLRNIVKPFQFIDLADKKYILAELGSSVALIDLTGKTAILHANEEIKKVSVAYSDSAKSCTLFLLDISGKLTSIKTDQLDQVNQNSTDSVNDILAIGDLKEDQIIFLSKNTLYLLEGNTKKNLETLDPSGEYVLVNAINNKFKKGIVDTKFNRFYMLTNSGKIKSGYPIYGGSRFNYNTSTDINENSTIVIGTADGLIYYYSE